MTWSRHQQTFAISAVIAHMKANHHILDESDLGTTQEAEPSKYVTRMAAPCQLTFGRGSDHLNLQIYIDKALAQCS